MKIVQREQSTTLREGNIERMQHKTSATSKKYNMKIVQHDKNDT